MGCKHGSYPEDGGGQEQELRDEVQHGVVNLTGRWNDKTCDAENDGRDKGGYGNDGLDFRDGLHIGWLKVLSFVGWTFFRIFASFRVL